MVQWFKFSSNFKLDNFLVSNEWEDHFSGISQFTLPRMAFDHCPIILKGGGGKKDKTPFIFENIWLLTKGSEASEKLVDWVYGYRY